MVSIKDVATESGLSVATVSRALNGHPSVSDGARERVLAAVESLGYRPNVVARSLRTDRTGTIGLVISDVLNPYFTELARAVEEEARALGYSVIIGNADERADLEDHHVRGLLERRIDGLLVSPADGRSPMTLEAAAGPTPVVFVDRWIPGADAPVVRADGRDAIRDLVDHLHSLGHRRIAVITGPTATTTGRERIDAFREALAEHGIPLPEAYIGRGDFQAESGRLATERFLDLPEPPTSSSPPTTSWRWAPSTRSRRAACACRRTSGWRPSTTSRGSRTPTRRSPRSPNPPPNWGGSRCGLWPPHRG